MPSLSTIGFFGTPKQSLEIASTTEKQSKFIFFLVSISDKNNVLLELQNDIATDKRNSDKDYSDSIGRKTQILFLLYVCP